MDSPFPGMDPYLEQHWRDVHHNLITFIQGALNSQLPEGLIVRVEERALPRIGSGIHAKHVPRRCALLNVVRRPSLRSLKAASHWPEPVTVHRPIPEPLTEGFIEIIDVGSGHRCSDGHRSA